MIGVGLELTATAVIGQRLGFSPRSLSPIAFYDPSNLSSVWQDTAGTTPVTADGQAVARIDDLSGNGYHLLQSTAASRPLWKTSGGISWLQFDGSNDWLVASGATVTLPGSHEISVAGYASQSVGTSSMFLSAADGTFNSMNASLEMGVYNAGGGIFRLRSRYAGGVDTDSTGPVVPGSQAFVAAQSRVSATALDQYVSGAKVGATITTATTVGANKYLRVGLHTSALQYIAGRVYGLVVTAALSANDRANLTTWLGAKAGLTL